MTRIGQSGHPRNDSERERRLLDRGKGDNEKNIESGFKLCFEFEENIFLTKHVFT